HLGGHCRDQIGLLKHGTFERLSGLQRSARTDKVGSVGHIDLEILIVNPGLRARQPSESERQRGGEQRRHDTSDDVDLACRDLAKRRGYARECKRTQMYDAFSRAYAPRHVERTSNDVAALP